MPAVPGQIADTVGAIAKQLTTTSIWVVHFEVANESGDGSTMRLGTSLVAIATKLGALLEDGDSKYFEPFPFSVQAYNLKDFYIVASGAAKDYTVNYVKG